MPEAKACQAKHAILPHHYMKIKSWLKGINGPYLCFWFTKCNGLFSWENTEKKCNLWNFHAWSHISTGKRHDTATPLYENKPLTQRHQLAISMFLIHHVQGSSVMRKRRKKRVICEILMREVTSSQAKGMILPQHYMKINPWLKSEESIGHIYAFDSPCARVFFPGKTQEK